jgi:serine protease
MHWKRAGAVAAAVTLACALSFTVRGGRAAAQPIYRIASTTAPSLYDPYQWYLFPRGRVSVKAVSNFGIQAEAAWQFTRGAGVTVALLDTGVAYETFGPYFQAPALARTHFVPGYDFVNNGEHPNDDHGDGTHTAGVLAGNLVGGGGTLGVAPDVSVMPVKVLNADGQGHDFAVAQGIRWAADHGASVIDLALGAPQTVPVVEDAVRYVARKDCVLVAPAGIENAATVNYPAAYSDCIAVGATGFDGLRAPYSNRSRKLELVAPGGNLAQDLNGDGAPDGILAQTFDPKAGYNHFEYTFYQGTGPAAAEVAGVAALVRAANPALSAPDVRLILRQTAFHLGPAGQNVSYGYGLVDALAAVQTALSRK